MPKIKILLGSLGAFLLILGGLIFFFPAESIRVVVIILAIGMILSGLAAARISLVEKNQKYRTLTFVIGAIDVIVGILFLSLPGLANLIGAVLVALMGISIAFGGAMAILDGLKIKDEGHSSRWLIVGGGALMGLIGLVMLINAFWSFLLLTQVMGISFII